MKNIQNFYVATQPEGNYLRWVGTSRNNSRFDIYRSLDELEFQLLQSVSLRASEAEEFEYVDKSIPQRAYYQIRYYEGEDEVAVSPVVKVANDRKRFKWLPFVMRILVAAGLIGVTMMAAKTITAPKPKENIRVTAPNVSAVNVETVTYQSFPTQVAALGQIVSASPIDIITEVGGRIKKGEVSLRKANAFKKDALLFTIDQQEALLSLKSQRSNLQNAIVLMLPDLQLDFPEAFDKWNTYFQNMDINTTLAPLPTITDQREKTFIASKNISGQYYSIKSVEERLSKYQVRAPYSGIITDVYTDAGSVANPGTRVIRIRRNDQIELELPIRQEDMKWVKTGTKVKLHTEDGSQSTTGRVSRISTVLDPTTQSINAYVSISPSGFRLYEGMYLNAEIAGQTLNQAMEIDRRAIFDDNKIFVMQQDSTLTEKAIKVHKVNTETVLFSGLEEGAQVVNDNLLGLTEGLKIAPLSK